MIFRNLNNIKNNLSFINAPKTGTINNLVIFIRFSDQSEFTSELSFYDNMFNNNVDCMNNYFKEASYNKLSVISSFYPTTTGTTVISYQDSNPRSYYTPQTPSNPNGYDDSNKAEREFNLLKAAINYIANDVPSNLNIDGDNDGRVDNVCFIIQGASGEWNDLLWPHSWSLIDIKPSEVVSINNKRVANYSFQLDSSINLGTLCHEMSHCIGYPDLYHYKDSDKDPTNDTHVNAVGTWDLLCYHGNTPQHMCAYMKYNYAKWLDTPPEISGKGPHTLNALTSPTNNCYIIKSPVASAEFFVVEYRKKEGIFESNIPDTGLLIYRINPNYKKDNPSMRNGNADGLPDEVFVCRPGLNSSNPNGMYISPDTASLSKESNRTTLGGSENPIFLSDGTDSKLKIIVVSNATDTISFEIADSDEKADLSINQVSLTNPAYVNKPLKFNIIVTNNGPNVAKKVIIETTLSGMDTGSIVITAPKGNWTVDNTGYIKGEITELAVNETITTTVEGIAYSAPLSTLKIFTSNASVKSDIPDPNLSNNTNKLEVQLLQEADLSITKKNSKDVAYKNEIIEYELTVKNNGPSTAENIEIIDYLPTEVEFISLTPNIIYTLNGKKLTIFRNKLNDQEEFTIKIKVAIKEFKNIKNIATVSSVIADPNLQNNEAISNIKVIEKLSTGPQIAHCLIGTPKVLIENTLSETVAITLYLKDLKNPLNSKFIDVVLKPNNTEVVLLKKIPYMYTLVIDKVPNGVYVTALIANYECIGNFKENCFVTNDKFNHTDFIVIDTI